MKKNSFIIFITCILTLISALYSCGIKEIYSEDTTTQINNNLSETASENVTDNISQAPTVLKMINSCDSLTGENLKLICGECEPFSTITITGDNIQTVEQYTGRSRFFIPIYMTANKNCKITLTSTTDGKEVSEPITVNCSKINSYAMTSFTVGSGNFVHFPDAVDFMCNNYSSTRNMQSIYKILNTRYENIRKATGKDTKFFILLMPDPLVLYQESASPTLQSGRKDAITAYNNAHNSDVKSDQMYTDMNKIAEYINAQNPKFTLVDMSSILRELKDKETFAGVYHTTDNHWSSYGAFYGYQQIMNFVYKTSGIEGTKPLELSDFTIENYKLSYSGQLGMPDPKAEGIYEVVDLLVPKIDRVAKLTSGEILNDGRFWSDVRYKMSFTTGKTELPTAVFLRDSFATALYPMLNEHFNNTYYSDTWDYTIDYDWLAQVKPDYVFVIAVERLSMSGLNQR